MERPPAAAHFCLSIVQENCNRVDGKNIKFRFVELMKMLGRSLHQQQMETRHLTRGCELSRFKCLPQRRLCPLHLELGVEGSTFVYGFSVKGVGFLISAFHCHCSFLNQCALFNYLFFPPDSPPRYRNCRHSWEDWRRFICFILFIYFILFVFWWLLGRMKYLTLNDPSKVWMPDLFFFNEREGHFHNIIVPNVYVRIFPNGWILYSIR
jgi:hypothetical protein